MIQDSDKENGKPSESNESGVNRKVSPNEDASRNWDDNESLGRGTDQHGSDNDRGSKEDKK